MSGVVLGLVVVKQRLGKHLYNIIRNMARFQHYYDQYQNAECVVPHRYDFTVHLWNLCWNINTTPWNAKSEVSASRMTEHQLFRAGLSTDELDAHTGRCWTIEDDDRYDFPIIEWLDVWDWERQHCRKRSKKK
jgi:hypothetical protein